MQHQAKLLPRRKQYPSNASVIPRPPQSVYPAIKTRAHAREQCCHKITQVFTVVWKHACGCSRWRRRGGGASKHALAESQGTNAIEHLFGAPRHHPAALAACAAGSQPGPMEPPFLPDFAPQDHVKRRSMSHEPSESLLEKFWRNFGESLRTLLSSYRR